MNQPEHFPEMVGILDTEDNFALGMATVALSEAGIVYDVVPIPDLPANLEAEKPKWWIRPTPILVSLEDANEARLLVEPFKTSNSDLSGGDVEMPDQEGSRGTLSQLIWKGPPNAPFIQRVGARLIGSVLIILGLFCINEVWEESRLAAGIVGAAFVYLGVWSFRHGLARNSK
jgi:hypothetical protein